MFRGVTKLWLNEITVLEALQEYLDKRMGEAAPKTRILSIKVSNNYDPKTFEVEMQEDVVAVWPPKPLRLDPEAFDKIVKDNPDIVGIPVYQRGDDPKMLWPKKLASQ
jgi:hypothetical protein